MKIYYYKQQQNTFALFGKKTPIRRLRYFAGGFLIILISLFGYTKLKQHHTRTALWKVPPVVGNFPSTNLDAETQATSINLQQNFASSQSKEDTPHPKSKQQPRLQPTPVNHLQTVIIRSHDTIRKIFKRLGISKKEVANVMASAEAAKVLKKLQPGQKLTLAIKDHLVQQLNFTIDPISNLVLTRTAKNDFKIQTKTANLDTKQSFAKFVVYGSASASAQKAGLNGKRISQLASIFKSSVDFVKGRHTGDQVSVLFQDYYSNGKKVKEGDIVAAEYKTATNTYQAVRFTDPKGNSGYYAPDGTSMQKRFLSAPLKFTRISSLFNPKRWHPILHRFRHHQGVDYAAPYGTPVKSVANGTIALLGRKGGYGNTIMIQHDANYSTLYGHLSKYASGLKSGTHVQQGQLIGYVGSSGLATGPHLHFEFRINGVHRNPLTVALPNGKSITHAYRNKFHKEVKKLLAKMDAHKNPNKG
jgi:murein DD-endopeptidase MepM/ murein hydrolase activator NlpD